jgi:anti-sigma factor RsiW
MDCTEAQAQNLDGIRGRLSPEKAAELQEHLSTCAACRVRVDVERALNEALESKLPQYAAPISLKRRLAETWPTSEPSAVSHRRAAWRSRAVATAALSAALAVVVGGSTALYTQRQAERLSLQSETVNDHLRLLEGVPLAQVTGGLHEVKPWFGGQLDFAPAVRFAGNAEFPLRGGAVEPFLDRRAAVFVYKRRLHTASLFVVRANGLAFPSRVETETVRGFSVVLWKADDQGYALVSDLNLQELLELQKEIASQ